MPAEKTRTKMLLLRKPSTSTIRDFLAAQSSLDFWDNPFDDKDWNDA